MKKHLSILIFLLISHYALSQKPPVATNGMINLKNFDLSNNEIVYLEGEWELYWAKLLSPADFEKEKLAPDTYINVPFPWTDLKINGKELPDTGFATLRLIIIADSSNQGFYSVMIPEVLTSYKLWINGKYVTETGKVGKNNTEAEPKVRFTLNSFYLSPGKNEIIIQISNYHHRLNAFANSPQLGKTEAIVRSFTLMAAYDFVIFGVVIILALYHLGLYLMRRNNLPALSFGILSLILSVRILFTDTYTMQFVFSDIPWRVTYFISYLTYYTLIPAFVYYFQTTFDEHKYKWAFASVYIVSAGFIITLFFSPIFYTKILYIYQIFNIFIIIGLIILMLKYLKQKRPGARILFWSFVIVFLTGINDILYYQNIIRTATLLPFGSFILILGQALTLARIFNKAFTENEKLTTKLDYQNKNLQQIVNERTKEIEAQKQSIILKNEELKAQKEELIAQKEQITEQNIQLEQNSKLITDSIRYASSIQKNILPTGELMKKYFETFIIFKPKDIVSGDFYWFSESQEKYLFFALGDCTGHGVPGAFLSLTSTYLLNTIINEKKISDPQKILECLELRFEKFLHKSESKNFDGMDICLLRFDKNDRSKIVYAGAKSDFLIYQPYRKELERLKTTRRSIGYTTNSKTKNTVKFESYSINIEKNSIIYLYSDGFVDQNNIERKRFGTTRFINSIQEVADKQITEQKRILIEKFEEFKQTEKLRDDVTVVALKVL